MGTFKKKKSFVKAFMFLSLASVQSTLSRDNGKTKPSTVLHISLITTLQASIPAWMPLLFLS